ncbi:MAG: hypothetical protein JSS11_02790 [Verrucomicrobia bacterium]|nr:hypothetical protein [Verrucomicrobiota bacterium]
MSKKIRSNSFAARLTGAQRDELFEALAGGLAYRAAGGRIRSWIKANDEAGLNGEGPHRELALADHSMVCRWYQGVCAERRYEEALEVAAVAEAQGPADPEGEARCALGRARWLAVHADLTVTQIVALERSLLARDRLALDREKVAMRQRRQAAVDGLCGERAQQERGTDRPEPVDFRSGGEKLDLDRMNGMDGMRAAG